MAILIRTTMRMWESLSGGEDRVCYVLLVLFLLRCIICVASGFGGEGRWEAHDSDRDIEGNDRESASARKSVLLAGVGLSARFRNRETHVINGLCAFGAGSEFLAACDHVDKVAVQRSVPDLRFLPVDFDDAVRNNSFQSNDCRRCCEEYRQLINKP